MKGSKLAIIGERAHTSSVEVLKTANNAVTQAKYTYAAYADKTTTAGHDVSDSTAITGKTYTLAAGDPIAVTGTTGTASDAEVALVRKHASISASPSGSANSTGRTFTRRHPVALPK